MTADHGEGLGEHGEGTHGLFLYDSTLARPVGDGRPGHAGGPGAEDDRALDRRAADAARLQRHQLRRGLDGRSLRPAADGREMDDAPAYAESLYPAARARVGPAPFAGAPRPLQADRRAAPRALRPREGRGRDREPHRRRGGERRDARQGLQTALAQDAAGAPRPRSMRSRRAPHGARLRERRTRSARRARAAAARSEGRREADAPRSTAACRPRARIPTSRVRELTAVLAGGPRPADGAALPAPSPTRPRDRHDLAIAELRVVEKERAAHGRGRGGARRQPALRGQPRRGGAMLERAALREPAVPAAAALARRGPHRPGRREAAKARSNACSRWCPTTSRRCGGSATSTCSGAATLPAPGRRYARILALDAGDVEAR